MAVGDQFNVELSTLRSVLRGDPVPIGDAESMRKLGSAMDKMTRTGITNLPEWKRLPQTVRRSVDPVDWLRVERTLRDSDIRMCRSIGVDRDLGAGLMANLWDRPFTDERDDRTGPEANAQRRGQISRQLKAQLEEAIP